MRNAEPRLPAAPLASLLARRGHAAGHRRRDPAGVLGGFPRRGPRSRPGDPTGGFGPCRAGRRRGLRHPGSGHLAPISRGRAPGVSPGPGQRRDPGLARTWCGCARYLHIRRSPERRAGHVRARSPLEEDHDGSGRMTGGLMRRSLALLVAGAGLLGAAGSTPSAAARGEAPRDYGVEGFVGVVPSEIEWVAAPGEPGFARAVLLGDPGKPGLYVVRVRLPAGSKVPPHTHPLARTYTVLAGEWKLGFGKTYDAAKLHSFPAGSLYHLPGMVPHFQAAGPVETVIEIHGMGPGSIDFIDPKDDAGR